MSFKIKFIVLCCLILDLTYSKNVKRALVFPPNSSTTSMIVAVAMPLSLDAENVYMAFNYAANYQHPRNASWYTNPEGWRPGNRVTKRSTEETVFSRKSVYKMIVKELKKFGLNGKGCLLKAICDVSNNQIREHNGVIGDIVHVILSPSTSQKENIHDEFYKAEMLGKEGKCEKYDQFCSINLLDKITAMESHLKHI